jgi:hypothetical protein
VSVESALRGTQALADATAKLVDVGVAHTTPSEPASSDRYIDTTGFLAHAAAVVREHGFAGAREAGPTWRRALAIVDTSADASTSDTQRALAIRAWATTLDGDGDEYRHRLAECLERDRLSSRELALAASAVRAYNRHLYWRIRREKRMHRAAEAAEEASLARGRHT